MSWGIGMSKREKGRFGYFDFLSGKFLRPDMCEEPFWEGEVFTYPMYKIEDIYEEKAPEAVFLFLKIWVVDLEISKVSWRSNLTYLLWDLLRIKPKGKKQITKGFKYDYLGRLIPAAAMLPDWIEEFKYRNPEFADYVLPEEKIDYGELYQKWLKLMEAFYNDMRGHGGENLRVSKVWDIEEGEGELALLDILRPYWRNWYKE
jgi:hypothetical protein